MAVNFVEQVDNNVSVERVLVSVSDKTGLEKIIPELAAINPRVTFYSTGGTYQVIREILGEAGAARHLQQVSEYTGQPEMQGGLVKTLDFKIYLGLLSETYNVAHVRDLARLKAVKLDMVIVNLYPFARTIATPGATLEHARANIDIGGPCMLRAAAKNFLRAAALSDPADYAPILEELRVNNGALLLKTRFELARKAFAHTAAYDTAIANYLAQCNPGNTAANYKIMN